MQLARKTFSRAKVAGIRLEGRALMLNRNFGFFDKFQEKHAEMRKESLIRHLRQSRPELTVLKYPHSKLRASNAPVTRFSTAELREKASKLLDAMYANEGIGLAAPQVGINERIMVFNETGERDIKEAELVLCNPELISESEETWVDEEACLSFPKIFGSVRRAKQVVIQYQDLDGEHWEMELEDLPARIFLHEFDHLHGVLFIDHFDEKDKKKNTAQLQYCVQGVQEAGAEIAL
eukprot:GSChrysophyteH1.ASY1.ANO1.1308.1 assembled CDS